MIILQIIQRPQYRGAELFALNLSRYLSSYGHKIIVVSLFDTEATFNYDLDFITLNRPYRKRNFDYLGWQKIAKIIFQYKPDIIQCNSGDTLKYMLASKMFFKWETPIIERNASIVGSYITNGFKKWAVGKLYERASYVVSVSEKSKDNLIYLYPKLKQKTIVIPIGIDANPPKLVEWKRGFDAQYHIIHVGGFTFEKNHKGLLSIYKKFLEEIPNSHLHLLGDGPIRTEIEGLVYQMGLTEKITFYGWVDSPSDYISKADLFVLPSLVEGLPSVILESMIHDTPVVAYDVGGVSQVLKNNITGYLIPVDNELDFAFAMKEALVTNTEKIRKNAYDMVHENYKMETIAKQFEEFYVKLLNN
jgi:glycosyltransferase involved in cell wall biosynthesis